MVTCICVRGSTLARLATVLVLLAIGNTPALRVTTLQARKPLLYELLGILLLYELLLFKREDLCSTSYYSSTSHLLASKTRTSAGARLLPGSSSCATEHLLLSSFQTHMSQPFIGKPMTLRVEEFFLLEE